MKLEVARPLGLSAMLVAAILIIVPFVNVAPSVLPMRLQVRDWRFGALGFFLSALTMPTLGLGLVMFGGLLRESRSALRTCFIGAAVLAISSVLGLAIFLMDGMTLRDSATDPGVHRMFNQGFLRTFVIALIALPALVALAVGSRRIVKGWDLTKRDGSDRLYVTEKS